MTLSVPDICDEFPDSVRVLAPGMVEFGGVDRFCGEITTVKCFEDNSVVRDLVKTPGNDRVIVVDGGGSLRHALLGDMLADAAAENGWSGLVINGCVRDVEILKTIPLGVRALNCHPVKSIKRGEGQRDVPVTFGGVAFSPGNYLYADANGIIVSDQDLGIEFQSAD